MIFLEGRCATELFTAASERVMTFGISTAPRGMATNEVLGAHLKLTNPRDRLVHAPPARVLNPAFAVAEAMWIISGSDDPWIFDFNRSLAQYADNGVLQGAYGPRLRRWRGSVDQLDVVRRQLLEDPDSRRAVVQLFDPARDHAGSRDVPCTLGYRFFIRDGRLHMHTTMRSNDLWLGFPYDIFTATLLQELLAGWLGVGLGDYRHSVDSLHLYEQHWAAAGGLPALSESRLMEPLAVPWDELPSLTSQVIAGHVPAVAGTPWAALTSVLASYRHWRNGDRHRARDLAEDTSGVLGAALLTWYDHLAAVKS